MPTCMMD